MAVMSRITCDTCHKDKEVNHNPQELAPKTCSECVRVKAAAEKKRHLERLATLSPEKRLELLEEFMYDHGRSYHPGPPIRF